MGVALLAVGCNNDDGGGSPTDPSQVNVEFSTTDLVVGTGPEAVTGNRATLNFELWLYNPAGTASKGTRVQGSFDANPQVPGTLIGPVIFVIGSGQLIPGFDQGVAACASAAGGVCIFRRVWPTVHGSGSQIPPNASIVFEVELTIRPVERTNYYTWRHEKVSRNCPRLSPIVASCGGHRLAPQGPPPQRRPRNRKHPLRQTCRPHHRTQ